MSQSRFSIVLVGVSALLRRPLVSRLRPADGERSSWVVFTARVGRFDSGFRSVGWPSGSLLPLFGTHRFGVAAGRVRSSAFRFGDCPRRVGSSARWLAFGFTASAFRHAPLWSCPRRVGSSAFRFGNCPRRVGLRASASAFRHAPFRRLPLGELAFGLIASAFRHAPLRRLPSPDWPSGFRFGDCRRAGWSLGSLLPLFGMQRFGDCPRRVGLRAHCFRFSARTDSGVPSAGWFFRWAGWPSGSPLPLFGMHRFAPPHCRSEDRRSTPTRHLFHFKTLIPTC